jgi:hypothetical protein
MLGRFAAFLSVGAVALPVAGCGGGGGDGDKTFQGKGYSFTYPEAWVKQGGEGNTGRIDALVAPPEGGRNLVGLTVVKNAVPKPVTRTNIDRALQDLRPAVDALLLREGGVLEGTLTKVTNASLPGIRFKATSTGVKPTIHQRGVWLFDGTTAYTLTCQSVRSGADEVGKACDQVVESFRSSD